jgi:hypothetical protein
MAMVEHPLVLFYGVIVTTGRTGSNAPRRRGAALPPLCLETLMTMRTRKLVGAILLMLFLAAYACATVAVAVVLQVNASRLTEVVFYVVAGLAWVVPAALLIRWMERPDVPGDRR